MRLRTWACTETSSADRFVEHDEARLGDEGARDRNPLSLASRKLTRKALRESAIEANAFQHRFDAASALGVTDAEHDQRLLH
jgi:hypothetical protein